MSAPLVSIITPVYNAAAWLPQCLDSIQAQSYPHWELILIDDGSQDNSAEIGQQYAAGDKRIKLFSQTNAGASAARNKGIEQARGEYICFVDADDHIKPNYLKDLIHCLSPENGHGLIIQGLAERNTAGEITKEVIFPECLLKGKQRGRAFTEMEIYMYGYAASKLYESSLIRLHHIRFNEKVKHAEDLLFMIEYIKICDYICFHTSCNYIYEHRGTSLSHSNRPFYSEKTCYDLMKNNLIEIRTIFGLQPTELSKMESTITLYLIFSLPALYRPPYTLPRGERLTQLRSFQSYELQLLKQNYRPWRKVDQIGKKILLARFFTLYDFYMSLLFFIRYQLIGPFRK